MKNLFDGISPVDYRYWEEDVAQYLSENAFTKYKLRAELALIKALHRRGICSGKVVQEVETACSQVTTEEVYAEEKRIRHDIRALVNCIRAKVSDEAKPYIHLTATSFDVVGSANAAQYRDVTEKVMLPALLNLEEVLIQITLREAEERQIGRTHGQHAVPITFGFTIAEYVSRLGDCICSLQQLASKLIGKFSGAVGAYNASSLFFEDPEAFEAEVLDELELKPADHSTQIVHPEPLTRLMCEMVITAGVLANLADDMRHLQRPEIGEAGEEFEVERVSSSTMPQKHNPINFENTKSCWKIVMPRIVTVFMDQISEHQRDLTNSASQRTYGEMVNYVVHMSRRLTRTMKKIKVDKDNLWHNLTLQQGLIGAEPLYIVLAALGHPDAHEKVRQLTLQAQSERRALQELIATDAEIDPYWKQMTSQQKKILVNPSAYTGRAPQRAIQVAQKWADKLGIAIEEKEE